MDLFMTGEMTPLFVRWSLPHWAALGIVALAAGGAPVGMPAAPDGEPFACGKDSGRGFPVDVSDGNIRPHRQRTLGTLAGQASAAFLQFDDAGLFYRPVVPHALGMRRGVFRRADGERPGTDYTHAS